MARKTKIVTIDAEGRDKGKVFEITEMSAYQAERWATRALLALGRSGIDVPPGIVEAGLYGVAALGIRAFMALQFAEAEPLLAEMMGCVQYIPDPAKPLNRRDPMTFDAIEEVGTLLRLRSEVFELHTGFSPAAVLSIWLMPAVAAAELSSNTSTSPEASAP